MADTGAPYFIPYAEPTDLVRDWPDLSEDVALAIVAALENIPVVEKRIEAFTGSGTWTVPAGVTYAIAYMMGGGGGVATQLTGGNGSDSSVAFASGTVIGPGQNRVPGSGPAAGQVVQAGKNGIGANAATGDGQGPSGSSPNTYVVHGAAVTPGASISVVVGAGGSGGTAPSAAGGSGHVYIEYYEEV
jgi:hypothetical protein